MAFWAAAQLRGAREHLALHFLTQAGLVTWVPRVRERKIIRGRRQVVTPALFPGYAFVLVELQWHAIRRTPYVVRLVMDGERPAKVPDHIIAGLRAKERNGVIELPKPPKLRKGDCVRIARGPLAGRMGTLHSGMNGHERVTVLLAQLGRVSVAASDVEADEGGRVR
jgi:transcriptional antiterminator RfaH